MSLFLQGLLFCPPLFNLMRSLDCYQQGPLAKSPMLSSIVNFMAKFQLPDTLPAARGLKKAKTDLVTGDSFEPRGVMQMLLGLGPDGFTVEEGMQEDAPELLTCLLNGLSRELAELREEGEGRQDGEDRQEEATSQTPIQVSKSARIRSESHT